MSKTVYSNEIREQAFLFWYDTRNDSEAQLAGELRSRPPFQLPPAFKDRNSRTCRIISKQGLI